MTRTRLLLVEDDDWVAEAATAILEELGFCVDHVWDGPAALARYERAVHAVILLDLRLPGIQGLEVYARLVQTPDLRVIFCSGMDAGAIDPALLARDGIGYLSKPWTIEQLVAQLVHVGVPVPVAPR